MTAVVDTAARLRRLLAILAWLAQVGEAPIDEVAAQFDLSPEALVTELEMAACCGVPPYTPDQLMEIVVTDTTVSTRVGTALARPRRLSPSEGFALAASARALLAVPGSDDSGALSRALAKLDRALGGEEVAVELDAPPLLPLVQRGAGLGKAPGHLLLLGVHRQGDRPGDPAPPAVRLGGPLVRRCLVWVGRPVCVGSGSTASARPSSPGSGTGSSRSAGVPVAAPTRRTADDERRQDFEPFVPGPDCRQGATVGRPVNGLADRFDPLGRSHRAGRRSGGDRDLRGWRCLARTSAPPAGPRRPGGRSARVPATGRRCRHADPAALPEVTA